MRFSSSFLSSSSSIKPPLNPDFGWQHLYLMSLGNKSTSITISPQGASRFAVFKLFWVHQHSPDIYWIRLFGYYKYCQTYECYITIEQCCRSVCKITYSHLSFSLGCKWNTVYSTEHIFWLWYDFFAIFHLQVHRDISWNIMSQCRKVNNQKCKS